MLRQISQIAAKEAHDKSAPTRGFPLGARGHVPKGGTAPTHHAQAHNQLQAFYNAPTQRIPSGEDTT
jgi:hypothetical protein